MMSIQRWLRKQKRSWHRRQKTEREKEKLERNILKMESNLRALAYTRAMRREHFEKWSFENSEKTKEYVC